MNKRKIALLDIDGVLLSWHKGFAQYMLEQGHELSMAEEYDLLQHYPSVGCEDKMLEYVKAFNASEGFGKLEPEPYTKALVEELVEQGYTLAWCSCFYPKGEMSNKSLDLRFTNITEVFGGAIKIELGFPLPLGESKTDVIKHFANNSDQVLFIDDSPKYIQEGLDVQKDFPHVKVAVWDQPYNQEVQADMRINTQYFLAED